jgi:hypothetical protein
MLCIDRQIVHSSLTLNGDGDADMEMPKRRPTFTPLNSTSTVHFHPTETNLYGVYPQRLSGCTRTLLRLAETYVSGAHLDAETFRALRFSASILRDYSAGCKTLIH